jgi:hypothetical protein
MALNNKQNIFLCRVHYIDADYAIIMILIGPLKWSDIWMSSIQILVICALSVGGFFCEETVSTQIVQLGNKVGRTLNM